MNEDTALASRLCAEERSDEARAWYEALEFEPSPTDLRHLFLLVKDLRAMLSEQPKSREPCQVGIAGAARRPAGHFVVLPEMPQTRDWRGHGGRVAVAAGFERVAGAGILTRWIGRSGGRNARFPPRARNRGLNRPFAGRPARRRAARARAARWPVALLPVGAAWQGCGAMLLPMAGQPGRNIISAMPSWR